MLGAIDESPTIDVSMTMHDRTAVTGTPSAAARPKRGEVIGERYEIRGKLRDDAFSLGFLAFDQELERSVLLRLIRAELLDRSIEEEVVERLRGYVGIGGKFLPGLLHADRDTDREGARVFAVEPVPEGVSLRDVLDRRIAASQRLTPDELTPLVAHLDAALAAIPFDLHHGDVRADNVWVDELRLQLTGAFLIPALPEGVVAAMLQRNRGLRRRAAPEQVLGQATSASDRFGVGAIVYEALALDAHFDTEDKDGAFARVAEPIREAVAALLRDDPAKRPTKLSSLLDALAFSAGLPVPELEPGSYRKRRRRLSVRGSVPPVLSASLPPPPILRPGLSREELPQDEPRREAPRNANAPTDRPPASVKLDLSAVPDLASPDNHDGLFHTMTEIDARRPAPPSEEIDLPAAPEVDEQDRTQPRVDMQLASNPDPTAPTHAIDRKEAEDILEAARARASARRDLTEAERRTRAKAAGLDPRLVRAALADDEEGSHHVEAADTRTPSREMAMTSEGVPLDPSVPVSAAAGGTQELRLDEIEQVELEAADSGVPMDPSVPVRARADGTQEISMNDLEFADAPGSDEIAVGAPVPTDEGMRALELSDLAGMAKTRERSVAAANLASPPLVERAPLVAPVPVVAVASLSTRDADWEPPTPSAAPRMRAPKITRPPRAPSNYGRWVILLALVLGGSIIGASFLYASHRRAEADELRRERLQQRFERLREEGSPGVP